MIADRYSLDREIGRGGMGAVWLGQDELLGRRVALKRVGVAPGGTSPEVARAEREAKLAASLSHPNVVSVFDLAPDGDVQWLVMEYVEGVDLAGRVRRDGPLSPTDAARVVGQVASALMAAHAAGVVHRDIKPSNILVTADGTAKLSDFGIARSRGDASLTQTGLVTGSPAYLSPEVASGRSATEASDIWSLGATAFHAVEGHPPYEIGDNLIGALYRIVHEEPPRPTSPDWLLPFFEATMTRDEDARWDAAQVRDFLDAGPGATRPVPTPRRRGRRPARGATRPVVPPVPAPAAGAGATQVLSPVDATPRNPRPVAAGGTGAPPPPRSRDRGVGRRLPVLLVVAAVLVVALLGLGAYLLLDGPGGGTDETAGGEPSASASAEPTPEAEGPTVEGMEEFARSYVATAAGSPRAGFDQLTAEYQQASNGFQGYDGFWGNVSNPQIERISADTDALTVSYRYSYDYNGNPKTENVTLQLVFEDGQYLISGT